jgi:hypothetical protein
MVYTPMLHTLKSGILSYLSLFSFIGHRNCKLLLLMAASAAMEDARSVSTFASTLRTTASGASPRLDSLRQQRSLLHHVSSLTKQLGRQKEEASRLAAENTALGGTLDGLQTRVRYAESELLRLQQVRQHVGVSQGVTSLIHISSLVLCRLKRRMLSSLNQVQPCDWKMQSCSACLILLLGLEVQQLLPMHPIS